MSEHIGMRRALVVLKQNPKICTKCKTEIQKMLDALEAKEAKWTESTFFSDK